MMSTEYDYISYRIRNWWISDFSNWWIMICFLLNFQEVSPWKCGWLTQRENKITNLTKISWKQSRRKDIHFGSSGSKPIRNCSEILLLLCAFDFWCFVTRASTMSPIIKVIISKLHGESFLWNKLWDLGWFWAGSTALKISTKAVKYATLEGNFF